MVKLMVLGAGINQLPMIKTALDYGLHVIAADPNSSAPGFEYAHEKHVFDLADHARGLEVARSCDIDGVVTLAADFPMPLLVSICEEMELAGPVRSAVEKSTDKARMRRAFAAQDVCSLPFTEVANARQAVDAVREFRVPAIFKPTLSSGGRGICRVDMAASEKEILESFERASNFSANKRVIVETLVEGPEYSVELITFRGETSIVALTEKVTTGAPYYVEIGHHQPASLSAIAAENLKKAALGAVRACGIDNAPSHAEIRLTDRGPVIMEVAARLGGGFISSHLTPLSTGVNLLRAAIDVSLGRSPDLTPGQSAGAAVAFMLPQPGYIAAIRGLEATRADPFCVDVQVYRKLGSRVEELQNATGRVGHVIARGPDGETAKVHAVRLVGMIKIETSLEQG